LTGTGQKAKMGPLFREEMVPELGEEAQRGVLKHAKSGLSRTFQA